MHLVQKGNHWQIEGPDCDRARIAYAPWIEIGLCIRWTMVREQFSVHRPVFYGMHNPRSLGLGIVRN